MTSINLPTNDLAFGNYPQRLLSPLGSGLRGRWRTRLSNTRQFASIPPVALKYMHRAERQARQLPLDALIATARRLGLQLRANGLSHATAGAAIACVAQILTRTLKQQPYETQLNAAWQMLQGNLVEMQTGEGKTLAAALAAATAGLAGSTVYVLTANDYLVRRDHDSLAEFFAVLGLSTGWVTSESCADDRYQNWRLQIVFSSARELAFDYLRDHVRLAGERDPVLARARALERESIMPGKVGPIADAALVPGLCFCIVDEADSLLLDEAVMPLIIASPVAREQGDEYARAYKIASELIESEHFRAIKPARRAVLTESGKRQVRLKLQAESGALAVERQAFEWVQTALAAQHLYGVDREYAVVGDQIALIDELTGRLAHGRQWQGVLHQMVELKEGLTPSLPSRVTAQITYQSLFPRVIHLCGMSGTLRDDRRELQALYGRPVVRIPLRRADCRRREGMRILPSQAVKWQAVIYAVKARQDAGRPVLVGTDSVADSAHLSGLLDAAGVRHQVLNATQSAAEAACLARAGRSGVVTVTTNIAGRGTDIRLTEAARRAGGLHVIATMCNRSRRVDRQLVGRAARQGDPGSFEVIVSCDDKLITRVWPLAMQSVFRRLCQWHSCVPQWLLELPFTIAQRLEERRDRIIRHALRDANKARQSQFSFAGRSE